MTVWCDTVREILETIASDTNVSAESVGESVCAAAYSFPSVIEVTDTMPAR